MFTGHTAKFENCTNGFQDGSYDIDIAISGLQYVGGICGQNGTFNNCNNTMSILYGNENSNEDYSYIGGIVGETQYEIKNCSNSGWINFLVPAQATSDSNFASIIGGIVGATDAKIEGCTNSGCITGNKAVGGILGYTTASVLYFSNNSNSGTIIGYGSGANYDANNCEGNTYVGLGGLIGIIYSHQSQVIKDCSNTGNISLGNNFYGVGGFIGLVLKTINDPVVDEYSILNATINYTLYKNSNTSVYGSLIGACGTKNNDDINLDAENSLIENINNSYNQNFVVE